MATQVDSSTTQHSPVPQTPYTPPQPHAPPTAPSDAEVPRDEDIQTYLNMHAAFALTDTDQGPRDTEINTPPAVTPTGTIRPTVAPSETLAEKPSSSTDNNPKPRPDIAAGAADAPCRPGRYHTTGGPTPNSQPWTTPVQLTSPSDDHKSDVHTPTLGHGAEPHKEPGNSKWDKYLRSPSASSGIDLDATPSPCGGDPFANSNSSENRGEANTHDCTGNCSCTSRPQSPSSRRSLVERVAPHASSPAHLHRARQLTASISSTAGLASAGESDAFKLDRFPEYNIEET